MCTHKAQALCTHKAQALCTHKAQALCTHKAQALCTHKVQAVYFGYRVCFASSGLGTREAESLPSSQGYGHITQTECRSVVDDGLLVLGVFGA